jgi:hypothetical protein
MTQCPTLTDRGKNPLPDSKNRTPRIWLKQASARPTALGGFYTGTGLLETHCPPDPGVRAGERALDRP